MGWLLGSRFLLLTHTGRRTGQTRLTVLEVVSYDRSIPEAIVTAAVAANMRVFGYAADSDEQALRGAGATAILRSLDELPQLLCLDASLPGA